VYESPGGSFGGGLGLTAGFFFCCGRELIRPDILTAHAQRTSAHPVCELVADSLQVEEAVGHRLARRDQGIRAAPADEVEPGLRLDGDEPAGLLRLQDVPQALRVEALPSSASLSSLSELFCLLTRSASSRLRLS